MNNPTERDKTVDAIVSILFFFPEWVVELEFGTN